MPGEISPELLAAVLSRTLEEAAFAFLEPAEAPCNSSVRVIEATLEISGERRAELRLAVPEVFAATLAANMLGEEEGGEDVTGDDEDAIGELLNMIAGAVAAEVFGRNARCALGIPRLRRVGLQEHRSAIAGATTVSMADEEGRPVHLASRWLGAAP